MKKKIEFRNTKELEHLTLFLNATDVKGEMLKDYLKIRKEIKAFEELLGCIRLCSKSEDGKQCYITFDNKTAYLDTITVSKKTYNCIKKLIKK